MLLNKEGLVELMNDDANGNIMISTMKNLNRIIGKANIELSIQFEGRPWLGEIS